MPTKRARPGVDQLVGAAAEAIGKVVRAARFMPGIAAGACLVTAGALVHPAAGFAVAAGVLLAVDRRMP